MGNRAYLYSSTVNSADLSFYNAKNSRDGKAFVIASEATNLIPVAWLCCFSSEDLVEQEFVWKDWEENSHSLSVAIPSVSKDRSIERLAQSMEIFISLASDEKIGREYWQHAMSQLKKAPYDYLVLNPIEVFFLNDPEEEMRTFKDALSLSESKRESIKRLCFFEDGSHPYPVNELMRNPNLERGPRLKNANALYVHFEDSFVQNNKPVGDSIAKQEKKWWKFLF